MGECSRVCARYETFDCLHADGLMSHFSIDESFCATIYFRNIFQKGVDVFFSLGGSGDIVKNLKRCITLTPFYEAFFTKIHALRSDFNVVPLPLYAPKGITLYSSSIKVQFHYATKI